MKEIVFRKGRIIFKFLTHSLSKFTEKHDYHKSCIVFSNFIQYVFMKVHNVNVLFL